MHRVVCTTLALLLAIAFALPDAATAKVCRRVCRKDVKACKKTCTGTRQEKRPCKQLCKSGLLEICNGFPDVACIPPSGVCGPVPVTCELLKYGLPGFLPGVNPLSSEFPPPPADARLCGTLEVAVEGGSAVFIFFATESGPDVIASYFAGQLAARGYGLAETPIEGERAGCDRGFAITQGTTTLAGLYLFAQQRAYAVALAVGGGGDPVPPPPGPRR